MSTENKNPRKPWEDNCGKTLPDDVLREVSKSWPPRIWEAYLKTIEVSLREMPLRKFEKVSAKHECQTALENYFTEDENSEARLFLDPTAVKQALLKLTFQQRKLVELVFFQELTVTAAAKEIGISRVAASGTLARALGRVREILGHRLEFNRAREEKKS